MRALTTFLICILYFSVVQAQSIKPKDLVAREAGNFQKVELLKPSQQRNLDQPVENLSAYHLLEINATALSDLKQQRHQNLQMDVAIEENDSYTLQLVQVDIYSDDFKVVEEPSGRVLDIDRGLHYRGIIEGVDQSVVAISIFDDEIAGFISDPAMDGNYVLGKMKDRSPNPKHIVYLDRNFDIGQHFQCDMEDTGTPYTEDQISDNGQSSRALSDCVRLFSELDYNMYQELGGQTASENYVALLYNQIITIYAAENINTVLSQSVIWSSTSPYGGTSAGAKLSAFQSNRNNFNGDLAQLLTNINFGGLAATIDGICASENNRMCVSGTLNSIATVPTYSFDVEVTCHEYGHLFGSYHTHGCYWNGNGTQIDDCGNFLIANQGNTPEGNACYNSNNPIFPNNGGTVMSYCYGISSVGINFSNGFGPQPGNAIRSAVSGGSCLQACGGGGGCTDNEVTLSLNTDQYGSETTWSIVNAGGSTVASGGPYGNNTSYTETACLPNGCYDFIINDSYGDGICCSYGNGSYSLTNSGGSVLASGGQFTNSETTNFCVGSTGPTCSDGIQNGNETGVDCGGSCAACPPSNSTILAHYFESGWDGWQDGGSDCYRYRGQYTYEGSYSIRLRDNSGTASAMTSSAYNLTSYSSIEMTFYFRPNSMETGEDFWVRFFDGSSWQTVATYASGSSFNNGQFYSATINLSSNDYNFASNSRFRIQCDASSNADQIYVDQITVTGGSGAWAPGQEGGSYYTIEALGVPPVEAQLANASLVANNVSLFPNPATDQLNIKYNGEASSIKIYNGNGAIIMDRTIDGYMDRLDISALRPGIYYMMIEVNGELIPKKFIKS